MADQEELKYPKGEEVWTRYLGASGKTMFILTSKLGSRDYYYLYELIDGKFKKLGKASSPRVLEDKFNVAERVLDG